MPTLLTIEAVDVAVAETPFPTDLTIEAVLVAVPETIFPTVRVMLAVEVTVAVSACGLVVPVVPRDAGNHCLLTLFVLTACL